jgi:3-oxoacyl-[acyl-carrier protein] reductase
MGDLLKGKVAVVTGSGQGIGRAIALAFAAQGAKVVTNNRKPGSTGNAMVTDEQFAKLSDERKAWYREQNEKYNGDAATTAKTIVENGGEASPFFGDISKIADAERLIQHTIDTYGKIDVLCNVAGTFGFSDLEDITDELWDRVLDTKPKGYFHAMKFAVPHMKKQGYGRIINCASPAFLGDNIKHAEYCAANAGVVGLTRGAAKELWAFGITVNCFCPAAASRAGYELEVLNMLGQESGNSITADGKGVGFTNENTPGPEGIAAFNVYLASDHSKEVSGAVFIAIGNFIGRYSDPAPVGMLVKQDFTYQTPCTPEEIVKLADEQLFKDYKSLAHD